jgi:subtilase family serine protease
MLKQLATIIAVAMVVQAAALSPATVWHEAPTQLLSGWVRQSRSLQKNDIDSKNDVISFYLSVKQQGLDTIRRIAAEVSDPLSSSYGKYLNQSEIDAITAARESDVATVTDWLHAINKDNNQCSWNRSKELVHVRCTVRAASHLLNTSFHRASNAQTGQETVLASRFALPTTVDAVITATYGLHGLPLPLRKSQTSVQTPGGVPITPAVIRSTYNVSDVHPKRTNSNRQAIASFVGETMSTQDLKTFFKQYVPNAKAGDDTVYKFVGGQGAGSATEEANLDVQYIMGVAPGVKTEVWYFGDDDFCTGLKNWAQRALATDDGPLVHSMSYCWQKEISKLSGCNKANVADIDADFAKLAAKGVTIIIGSGDEGSGWVAPPSQCSQCKPVENTTLVGTLKSTTNKTVDAAGCCDFCSSRGTSQPAVFTPFAYTGPKAYCQRPRLSNQALTGIIWNSFMGQISPDQCCLMGEGYVRDGWSLQGWAFTPSSKNQSICALYSSVNGTTKSIGSISLGFPPPKPEQPNPPAGKCDCFSSVTHVLSAPQTRSVAKPPPPVLVSMHPGWPTSSPWVTSVGGTRFVGQKIGNPEMVTNGFGTGGGFSFHFAQHSWQAAEAANYVKRGPQLPAFPPVGSFPPSGRATPDVSGLAENYQVVINGGTTSVSGTSAATPMFAGLVSLLNEVRLAAGKPAMGFMNPWIYANPSMFTDITQGSNAFDRSGVPLKYGYAATKGWDAASGVGTPLFDRMMDAALADNAII